MASFSETLARKGIDLRREKTEILMVNVGGFCNQSCAHCHHHCGPGETDVMDQKTASAVADFALKVGFKTIDITGGAPEFSDAAVFLTEALEGRVEIIFRTNLTALGSKAAKVSPEFLAEKKVRIAASFPSPDKNVFEAQRGRYTFDLAVSSFGRLNDQGYGVEGSGLILDIAANPVDTELPPPQQELAALFKTRLLEERGLVFNGLYAFANMPLGRFRERLGREKKRQSYQDMLEAAFCPETVKGLMCRFGLCADYRGILYDCDFNLAAGLPFSGRETGVAEIDDPASLYSGVVLDDHCYACTAGAGFT